MNDTAQFNLKEPEQTDWDNYNSGSKYSPPPPAAGADGRLITYYGVASKILEKASDFSEGYINFSLDPVRLVRSGQFDGYEIRFVEVNARPKTKGGGNGERTPIKGNPTTVGDYLRSVGLQVKPQTNAQYREAMKASTSRTFGFVIDWVAKNKDTGETIKGYASFPDDPERPGQKKSILKHGDLYNETDAKGAILGTKTVQSDVLFANARLRWFVDPKRG